MCKVWHGRKCTRSVREVEKLTFRSSISDSVKGWIYMAGNLKNIFLLLVDWDSKFHVCSMFQVFKQCFNWPLLLQQRYKGEKFIWTILCFLSDIWDIIKIIIAYLRFPVSFYFSVDTYSQCIPSLCYIYLLLPLIVALFYLKLLKPKTLNQELLLWIL